MELSIFFGYVDDYSFINFRPLFLIIQGLFPLNQRMIFLFLFFFFLQHICAVLSSLQNGIKNCLNCLSQFNPIELPVLARIFSLIFGNLIFYCQKVEAFTIFLNVSLLMYNFLEGVIFSNMLFYFFIRNLLNKLHIFELVVYYLVKFLITYFS